MASPRSLNVPEVTPIAQIDQYQKGGWSKITPAWLSLMREMARILRANALQPVITATALFDATLWTADAGLWTLTELDVVTWGWLKFGRQMTVVFEFATTTVTAAPLELRVLIPNREVAKYTMRAPCVLSDNGVAAAGVVSVTALGTTLVFTRLDGAVFTVSVDLTAVRGTFTFEVQ